MVVVVWVWWIGFDELKSHKQQQLLNSWNTILFLLFFKIYHDSIVIWCSLLAFKSFSSLQITEVYDTLTFEWIQLSVYYYTVMCNHYKIYSNSINNGKYEADAFLYMSCLYMNTAKLARFQVIIFKFFPKKIIFWTCNI